MTVAIIDYGSGNLRSAAKAFERAAQESAAPEDILVTSNPAEVASSDRIVLPGVGAFADCKRGLEALPGMIDALNYTVCTHKRPFLGICVGMQLMAARGFEHVETDGLGWLDAKVVALDSRGRSPSPAGYKVPHMGWNEVSLKNAHPVFNGIDVGMHAYFVHSFHMECADICDVLATTTYGQTVTAAVSRGNMIGTQFHPEKSQALGLKFIANFLAWTP
ncbi:MAG TPA: imidazole glycerol phosphate synthase subunit HisH [Rhodospirillaceae bacterium]|nr:imidazole glycerol phosphate synthase subunit HisH [Rhodospirillaceae bacterium]